MSTELQLSSLIFCFNHKMINYLNFQKNNLWKQPSSFRFRGRLRRETLHDRRIVCSIVFAVFRELIIFFGETFVSSRFCNGLRIVCSPFKKSIQQSKIKFLLHIINYSLFLAYKHASTDKTSSKKSSDIPKLFSTLKEWLNLSSTSLELQLEQVCNQSAVLRRANENLGGSFFKSPIYNYPKNHSMEGGGGDTRESHLESSKIV